MNEIKNHVEAIQGIMKEKYGLETNVYLNGHNVDSETAKVISVDAESEFGGKRRERERKGTRWSQLINYDANFELTMFWEDEVVKTDETAKL